MLGGDPRIVNVTNDRNSVLMHYQRRYQNQGKGMGRYDSGDDGAGARFWMGLIVFLLVAAAYPFYSYWVQARLLARDVARAGEAFSQQLEAENARMNEQARKARIAKVSVVGTAPNRNGPIAIVRLEQASLDEATPTICRQAANMLGSSLAGRSLRVQRHRGGQPAVDIGTIRC